MGDEVAENRRRKLPNTRGKGQNRYESRPSRNGSRQSANVLKKRKPSARGKRKPKRLQRRLWLTQKQLRHRLWRRQLLKRQRRRPRRKKLPRRRKQRRPRREKTKMGRQRPRRE